MISLVKEHNEETVNLIPNHLKEEINTEISEFIEDIISLAADTLDVDELDLSTHINEISFHDRLKRTIHSILDNALEDLIDDKSESLAAEWENNHLPVLQHQMEQDGQVDGPARREDWANFIDMKSKNEELGEFLAFHCDWDVENV
jgi:hypothetical protein